jgi:hypothetical protein
MPASLPGDILVRLLGEIDEALSGDVDPIPAPSQERQGSFRSTSCCVVHRG